MNKYRKKMTATLLIAIFLVSLFTVSAIAKKEKDYATIKDGTITYGRVSDESTEIIPIGVDQWGYNYQAHIFVGFLDNYARPDTPVPEGDITLVMKWSDTWLSNKDRDGDTKLDRGYPYRTNTEDPEEDPIYTSSAAPGAWLTNHQWGTYEEEGEVYHWTYFVKIVHPGNDAYLDEDEGVWYTEQDGTEIGPSIWGAYAIIQEFENNVGHDVIYKSPSPVGFGYYKP